MQIDDARADSRSAIILSPEILIYPKKPGFLWVLGVIRVHARPWHSILGEIAEAALAHKGQGQDGSRVPARKPPREEAKADGRMGSVLFEAIIDGRSTNG